MRDLSCTPTKIPICSMDETKIPSIYASREDPESESRISLDSILLFFLSSPLTFIVVPVRLLSSHACLCFKYWVVPVELKGERKKVVGVSDKVFACVR
jgi:hypothetical protein